MRAWRPTTKLNANETVLAHAGANRATSPRRDKSIRLASHTTSVRVQEVPQFDPLLVLQIRDRPRNAEQPFRAACGQLFEVRETDQEPFAGWRHGRSAFLSIMHLR